jgi:REP element-mobilizing transposase RayT
MVTNVERGNVDRPCGRMRHLPVEYYRGHAYVLWNMTITERATGWLDNAFHLQFRELHLHTLARYELMCPMYCLMPDHMHILWIGLAERSDQHLAARFFRRYLNALLDRSGVSLQKQAWDTVLDEKERERGAIESTLFYLAENPVRRKMVEDARNWPYSGALVPGYPELSWRREDYRALLWKIYATEIERRC